MDPEQKSTSSAHGVQESMSSERGIEQYKALLDISPEDLSRWQTVVDLGTGTQQELAKGLLSEGYDRLQVISIDPALALSEETDLTRFLPEEIPIRLEGRYHAEKGTLAALAQSLPFPDESVDAILALYSVPRWLKTNGEIVQSLAEMIRIVKKGGEIRIYPVQKTKNLGAVSSYLEGRHDIEPNFRLKEHNKHIGEEKYLLVIKKR